MDSAKLVLALLDEAYEKKTWHGPNLKQSIKGITARQAAWRPGPGRHNIWEVTLHAAYWKYAVRRRIEGGKRGSFALKGSNFFVRPEKGKLNEATWSADKKRVTFKLRQGVKWHDGKPFTSKDVGCTFDLLLGKAKDGLRLNPRQAASPAGAALISLSAVAVTEQERLSLARPEKGELPRSPTRQPRDTRRRSPT